MKAKCLGIAKMVKGQIDDVRIFNCALTAAQVKEVVNGGAVRFE